MADDIMQTRIRISRDLSARFDAYLERHGVSRDKVISDLIEGHIEGRLGLTAADILSRSELYGHLATLSKATSLIAARQDEMERLLLADVRRRLAGA